MKLTKKQLAEVLEKSGNYMLNERPKVKETSGFIKGTGNGLLVAADLIKGKIVGDVIPRYLPTQDTEESK